MFSRKFLSIFSRLSYNIDIFKKFITDINIFKNGLFEINIFKNGLFDINISLSISIFSKDINISTFALLSSSKGSFKIQHYTWETPSTVHQLPKCHDFVNNAAI